MTYKPGESGNPAGRPPGPNKFTQDLRDMILGALDDAGGREYLAKQAVENPGPFLALIGRVLPKEVVPSGEKIERNRYSLSLDELRAIAATALPESIRRARLINPEASKPSSAPERVNVQRTPQLENGAVEPFAANSTTGGVEESASSTSIPRSST